MSAIVAALLGLLPEAFALFKGKDKKEAAENFALAAVEKAKTMLGVESDADALNGIQKDPALFLQWQTEMNAQARLMAELSSKNVESARGMHIRSDGVLVMKVANFTLWANPLLAYSLIVGYIGSAILMAWLKVDNTVANVINTVAGPLVGAMFQQLMQERDKFMTFVLGADYTKKEDNL